MPSFRVIASATTILLLAINVLAGEDSQFVTNLKAGKPQTLVAYGTSLTAACAWVGQLDAALKLKYPGLANVVNSGASSMWSKWGVDNLDEYVIQKKPDTVLIEFAINDAYLEYKTSVEEARKNLINMIDRIQKANKNCEVILMTMNPSTYADATDRPKYPDYYQMYRDVAKERKLRLIDHYVNWKKILDKDKDLFLKYVPDGLHPGEEGCKMVILPEMLKSLGVEAEPPAVNTK